MRGNQIIGADWSDANDLNTGGGISDFSNANDLDGNGNIADFSAANDLDSSGNLQQRSFYDFNNNEKGDYTSSGRLYWDYSAGLYIGSGNADFSDGDVALIWSNDNVHGGNAISLSEGSEGDPTIAVNEGSISHDNIGGVSYNDHHGTGNAIGWDGSNNIAVTGNSIGSNELTSSYDTGSAYDTRFVQRSGDSMTGQLTIPTKQWGGDYTPDTSGGNALNLGSNGGEGLRIFDQDPGSSGTLCGSSQYNDCGVLLMSEGNDGFEGTSGWMFAAVDGDDGNVRRVLEVEQRGRLNLHGSEITNIGSLQGCGNNQYVGGDGNCKNDNTIADNQNLGSSRSGDTVTISIDNGNGASFTDNYEANTDRQLDDTGASSNVDMNGNSVNNVGSMDGQNGFQLPTGADAY